LYIYISMAYTQPQQPQHHFNKIENRASTKYTKTKAEYDNKMTLHFSEIL